MTAPSPRSNLRRWLKPAAYLAMISAVCWSARVVIHSANIDHDVREWTMLAEDRGPPLSDRQICVIPGLELKPVGRVFAGRRQVMVVLDHAEDDDALLDMPDCPVKPTVATGSQLAPESMQRLQFRFESENVE